MAQVIKALWPIIWPIVKKHLEGAVNTAFSALELLIQQCFERHTEEARRSAAEAEEKAQRAARRSEADIHHHEAEAWHQMAEGLRQEIDGVKAKLESLRGELMREVRSLKVSHVIREGEKYER